jgi:hypothetical protein
MDRFSKAMQLIAYGPLWSDDGATRLGIAALVGSAKDPSVPGALKSANPVR